MSVIARLEPRVIPTYPVGAPEKNPVFFEKRVYQGSSGKVYPVPFIDKVFDEPVDVTYQSALLENEFVRLVMLPEIGGRIFLGQDKTNADYDFFYRQDVIKPALVGLAGPWISGGVEFNWPQHHRPGTFMPADVHIEEEGDGARTVWMSEHDPLNRLKGMHGIRLRPGSSLIELRARLYNRTPHPHLPLVGQRRRRGARPIPVVLPARCPLRRRPRGARDVIVPDRRKSLLRRRLSEPPRRQRPRLV
jgi:hypothetical protein